MDKYDILTVIVIEAMITVILAWLFAWIRKKIWWVLYLIFLISIWVTGIVGLIIK